MLLLKIEEEAELQQKLCFITYDIAIYIKYLHMLLWLISPYDGRDCLSEKSLAVMYIF